MLRETILQSPWLLILPLNVGFLFAFVEILCPFVFIECLAFLIYVYKWSVMVKEWFQ